MHSFDILEPLFHLDSVEVDIGALESDNFVLRRQENRAFLLYKIEVMYTRRDHSCAKVRHVVHCIYMFWEIFWVNVDS